jgi:hypothetical protein
MNWIEAQQKEHTLHTLIDEKYTARPFYGSRRMVEFLQTEGQRRAAVYENGLSLN